MNTANYIEIRKKYIKGIQQGMQQYFWENLFKELFAVFDDNTVNNSKSDLTQAIRSGRVYYYQGAFRTQKTFNNDVAMALENMGAKFKYGAYYIKPDLIPLDIKNLLSIMQVKGEIQMSAIDKILAAFTAKALIPLDKFISETVKLGFKQLETDILKEAIDKKVPVIELGLATPKAKGLEKAAKKVDKWHNEREKEAQKLRDAIAEAEKNNQVAKAEELQNKLRQHNIDTITQAPDLSVKIDDLNVNYKSAKIAEDYIYNMNFWVKKWETKNIVKMRSDIMDLYQKGARIPEIQAYIQNRWKIAKDKAAFLAENECGLVTTAVQAATWQESGATKFRWMRSVSREKRELHRQYYDRAWCEANNKPFLGDIFYFDDPPILDEKLGIKGLPRQIWNCKCGMAIVVPTLDEIMKAKKEQRSIYKRVQNAIKPREYAFAYKRFKDD